MMNESIKEALTRVPDIRLELIEMAADLVDAFDLIAQAARDSLEEWSFEFQVGNNRLDRYDNLRDALNRAEYLNGPWLEQMKEYARMEQEEEDRTGVITSNTYRYAYTRALEERPVKVMMRKVTPWRLP